MKEVAREFLAKLASEEDKCIAKIELDKTGAGLVTAIKEFDHYCRVGGGAPRGRWPPSAAQTVRAVFPHTAFTKTSSRDEDRWRNQRVEPSSGPSGSASRQVSSVADVGVFHSWNCPPQRPCSSHRPVWSRPSSPAAFPNPLGCRPLTVTRLSPRFRYYSAVRLLDEHPFPLRSRL